MGDQSNHCRLFFPLNLFCHKKSPQQLPTCQSSSVLLNPVMSRKIIERQSPLPSPTKQTRSPKAKVSRRMRTGMESHLGSCLVTAVRSLAFPIGIVGPCSRVHTPYLPTLVRPLHYRACPFPQVVGPCSRVHTPYLPTLVRLLHYELGLSLPPGSGSLQQGSHPLHADSGLAAALRGLFLPPDSGSMQKGSHL